ncbi:MAG: cation diffusion facilitator family transporter [Sulfurimicrobium sp.]|nr:cation diffusion facilitator family transporter [Sulfurimicrobium sp.]MDO9191197.1 cation diffusion facilitator family transporter [Sulfurimicrobium sp.]MDP1704043.1 cation diffusion facilitator family transporter [Sulfurimicrobium sp.]MDP1896661.1 cation diffusion facilitator family transporter [Sulfurimicrobium sp.]MDP2198155.1 cation diffusion facilitator family transporter [Sulfurimicrobium sp.]
MAGCCENKSCTLNAMRANHGRVLKIVLAVNIVMFVVETLAGLAAHSTSLLADAADMLGDALVYGFSLYVLTRDESWQARAALLKGLFMLAFGLGVAAEAVYKTLHPLLPHGETIGLIGLLALAANTWCFLLLYRHRADNLNMSSVWLCSRNDLFANGGVILAGIAVIYSQSRWPDIIVGGIIAALFLKSAVSVLRQSIASLRQSN